MAAMTSTASFAVGIISPPGVQSAEKAIVRPSTLTTPMMGLKVKRSSASRVGAPRPRIVMSAAAEVADKARAGAKDLGNETLLTPRFYTTDFDEMEKVTLSCTFPLGSSSSLLH